MSTTPALRVDSTAPPSFLLQRVLDFSQHAFSAPTTTETALALHSEKKALSARLRSTEQRLHRGDEERIALMDRIRAILDEKNELTAQIAALTSSTSKMETKLSEEKAALEEQITQLLQDQKDLDERTNKQREQLMEEATLAQQEALGCQEHLLAENRQLKERVLVLTEDYSRATDQLKEKERHMLDAHASLENDWSTQKADLQAKIAALEEDSRCAAVALARTKERAHEQHVELRNLMQENEHMCEEHCKALVAKDEKLHSVRAEFSKIEGRELKLKAENTSLQVKVNTLTTSLSETQEEGKRSLSDCHSLRGEVSEAQRQLREVQEEKELVCEEHNQALLAKDEELTSARAKVATLELIVSQQKVESTAMQINMDTQAADLTAAKQSFMKSLSDCDKLRGEVSMMQQQLHQVRKENDELCDEHRKVLSVKGEELASAKSILATLEERQLKSQAEVTDLQCTMDALAAELSASESEAKISRSNCDKLREQVSKYQQLLQEAREESDQAREQHIKTNLEKEEKVCAVEAQLSSLQERESKLKMDLTSVQRRMQRVVAELEEAEKVAKTSYTQCELLRIDASNVQRQFREAKLNYEKMLAEKEEELEQALTNSSAVGLDGSASVADNLHLESELSEIQSDRSLVLSSTEVEMKSPERCSSPGKERSVVKAAGTLEASERVSSPSRRNSDLERALQNEKRTAAALREQVRTLIEALEQKEEMIHTRALELDNRPSFETYGHGEEDEEEDIISPSKDSRRHRRRTQSTLSPIIPTHVEDSFRNLSRFLRGANGNDLAADVAVPTTKVAGHLSPKRVSRMFRADSSQPDDVTDEPYSISSMSLGKFLKKKSKAERKTSTELALPKASRTAPSLRKLRGTLGGGSSRGSPV